MTIQEKSLANIDVVCLHNSIQTVTKGLNDIIYMKENDQFSQFWYRTPRIEPGYYTIETLALAIQDAINLDTHMPGTYTVEYDQRLARYKFSNSAQRFGWFFVIYSRETQELGEEKDIATIPRILENGNGAWRLMGMLNNPTLVTVGGEPIVPGTASDAPNLQYATQLFIKTSLGIAAQSVGPKGNMSISRRVVLDQPTFGLIVDRHSTSWDSFQIPGNTTISSFTVQLCDYEGNIVDLNGQNWSFSISIFRETI